jgi:hypothetical protein
MLKYTPIMVLILGCFISDNAQAEDLTPNLALGAQGIRGKSDSQISAIFDGGVFTKEGRRYRKFQSAFGSIYVLDNSKLSKHDIENAQCVPGMATGKSEVSEAAMIGTESKVVETNDWKVYSALIQQTIKSRCDGSVQMQVPMNPHMDLGITQSLKDKRGNGSEIRVFNRDLQPNLNLEMHF